MQQGDYLAADLTITSPKIQERFVGLCIIYAGPVGPRRAGFVSGGTFKGAQHEKRTALHPFQRRFCERRSKSNKKRVPAEDRGDDGLTRGIKSPAEQHVPAGMARQYSALRARGGRRAGVSSDYPPGHYQKPPGLTCRSRSTIRLGRKEAIIRGLARLALAPSPMPFVTFCAARSGCVRQFGTPWYGALDRPPDGL